MQTFRLFVSSPGDVMVERRRVENVVSRLNGEFAGVARLDAIRWETQFYQSYSTFQAQIPRSTDCDLVIGILRWRLGSELPPDFPEKLSGDQPFPSGTAYELLTAIDQRKKGGKLPDIYLFRFAGGSPPVPLDDPNREKIERDWQALKHFFEQWFLTAQGHFKAAFNRYDSEDDFEAQLEQLLRKWVADKVTGGRVVRWPIEVKGSPFCGLSAFGAKHAPVFFGRSTDVGRAVDLWREAGSRGSPYLLIIGASGSGKSSLARAGLLPRLSTPGVIKETDVWRVAVMRPGDSPAGPFAALAAALLQDESALPKEEEGRGPALPEIAQGDSQTPAELATVLRHADAAAINPIVNALSRVGAAERSREKYGREVRCDLLLLIDQFEELFAASVSDAERDAFVDLIAALLTTGRVWIAATLRADFYSRMLDQPGLKKLKELGATYDLAPPGQVELAEIVRAPAEAAGLVFESDPEGGERLDARLLRDADRPDMLPLVQLALSRLFEGREVVAGETVLPFKVYNSLGGLKGIINEAGEKALASFGDAEKARLPWLLRQLAVPAAEQDGLGKGALTISAVPLAQAAPAGDEPARKLVGALVGARLLTTTGSDADAQVRLTHQRVLEDWERARSIVADNADFYRIRAEVEEQRRRWEAARRSGDFLIGRGRPLAEAESIARNFPNELPPATRDFIRSSGRRARLLQTATAAAAVLFAIVAGLAFLAKQQADDQRERTEQALASTTEFANVLVYEVANDPRVKDLPAELLNGMLVRAMQGYDKAIALDPDFAAAYRGRADAYSAMDKIDQAMSDYNRAIVLEPNNAHAYLGRGNIYLHERKPDLAIADYDKGLQLDPNNDLILNNRGNAYSDKGDLDQAITDYSSAIARKPDSALHVYNRGLAYNAKGENALAIADYNRAIELDPHYVSAYVNRGTLERASGDLDQAIADDNEAIALDPKNAVAYNNRGNAYSDKRDLAHAIADYSQAIAIDPNYGQAFLGRAIVYDDNDEFDRAISDYSEAVRFDPNNVAIYGRRGFAYSKKGDFDSAIADFDRAIAINPNNLYAYGGRAITYAVHGDHDRAIADYDFLIAHDPQAFVYRRRGDSYRSKGDLNRALADYSDAIKLDPTDADVRDIRGLAYLKLGRLDEALADLDAAIAINPKLASALYARGLIKLKKGDAPGADADMDAAKAVEPDIAASLASYGIN